jgi:hypothetical protein
MRLFILFFNERKLTIQPPNNSQEITPFSKDHKKDRDTSNKNGTGRIKRSESALNDV